MNKVINRFNGDYEWLSNFWYNSKGFNVESWYQSYKTTNVFESQSIRNMKPADAKKYSYSVDLRPDWELIKLEIMEDLVRFKFDTDHNLKMKLIKTVGSELIEGNTWHDNFWGSCICNKCGYKGKNMLGITLMKLRNDFINEMIDEWHNKKMIYNYMII